MKLFLTPLRFITPSLFEAFGTDESQIPTDEYHYTQWLGKEEARTRLEQHWSTWFTEYDFHAIANYGLTHVRIPIGYWAFCQLDGDPYVQGQEKYLDLAIGWARNAGLNVWIDLHGAPGSQNGFDNSGLRDQYGWQTGNNVETTLGVLDYISKKYGASEYADVVTSIELLNEPLGPAFNMDGIKSFYQRGYDIVRKNAPNLNVVFHDAFQSLNYWNDFFQMPSTWLVTLDHHQYQVFSPGENACSIDKHIEVACAIGRQTQSEYHWRVTGEFSAALTDCTKWLNGVGRGARYDGSFSNNGAGSYYIGSCANRWDISTWTDQERENSRRFVEAQFDAYDQGSGWIFWTYKTENSVEWDFRRLVDNGIIPFPLNERKYPNQCGF
jgi:glucan 1,3-beta-glucosidase